MKKMAQQELEKEFGKIISNNPNDINLENEDLQLLIESSESKQFLFGISEFSGENSAYTALILALEHLKFVHEHKAYIIHFKVHPNYPLRNISHAMDIIHGVAHENAVIIFGTTCDNTLANDFAEVRAFISLNK